MSTKINVRSPFYLNLTEPSVPEPTFTCEVANIKNLTIDQQGQISTPDLDYGIVLSITSNDSDFSNDKFPTVSTTTSRDLIVRVLIPSNFSNVSTGYLDCPKTVQQPAVNCSDGPTANGSVPAQTIDANGGSATINLASYFTQGTLAISAYTIYNPKPTLLTASESGGTLTISSSNLAGSANLQVSASDSGTNTCTATQTISVTVSAPTVTFSCANANFRGGTIAQDGTITKPNSEAQVGTIRTTSGDTSTNITSYPANTTGSARTVTLFFDLTVPAGYANAGATVECSLDMEQPAGDPEFTCAVANLSGQQISEQGVINVGTAQIGTIASFSPISFSSVNTKTSRQVTFQVTPPATGYSNSGGSNIPCTINIPQPAFTDPCGTNPFLLSTAQPAKASFCTGLFSVRETVTTTATSIENARGHVVCLAGSPMLGGSFLYAVNDSPTQVGIGTGRFNYWKINDEGLILEVGVHTCPDDGSQPDGIGILL